MLIHWRKPGGKIQGGTDIARWGWAPRGGTITPPDFGGTLLPLAVLIRRRLAAVSAAFPGIVTSDDPYYPDHLIHACAIQYDANAPAATTTAHAGDRPDWQPVIGLGDVACLIVWKKSTPTEGEGRPGVLTIGKVQFAQSIVADRRHRLVYTDPDSDLTLYAYLRERVRNAHMMNHHWVAEIQNRPL